MRYNDVILNKEKTKFLHIDYITAPAHCTSIWAINRMEAIHFMPLADCLYFACFLLSYSVESILIDKFRPGKPFCQFVQVGQYPNESQNFQYHCDQESSIRIFIALANQ